MSSPQPPVPIQDHCSVIVGDTLYVYSPAAFLSLPLKQNATWSTLPSGVSVKGAKCVQGLDNGPGSGDALWVVGGAANETTQDYPGLQKFSFGNQSWQSIEPAVKVTQNRQNHGAAFLNATGEILVYSGSQTDPNTPSIETFVISTQEPYNVLSFSSQNDPLISPVLLPWDDSSAIAIGGDKNTQIYRFVMDAQTKKGTWHDYPTQLSSALKGAQDQQAVLVQGTDGSKVLEMFDMSVNPCEASTLVLQDADGQPAETGETVGGGGSGSSKKRKRDLTLSDWPAYNSTAAPAYTRNGFSVAKGASGLVAMTGGNDQHPVSLFDDSSNAWVDTSQFFGAKDDVNVQSVIAPRPSSTPAPSHAPTTAPTPPPPPGLPNHHRTSVILGAVLGSILGLIAILVILLLLFYMRNKKKRQETANAAAEDEKRRMSFADRGAPFMMEGGQTEKQMAHGSIALMGNAATNGRPATGNSDTSTSRLIPRKAAPGPMETHEMSTIGEHGTDSSSHVEGNRTMPLASDSSRGNSSNFLQTPKRSSGWSRYFSGNNAAAAGAGAAVGAGAVGAGAVTGYRKAGGRTSADTYSNYTTDSSHDCSTHGPTEIPPLKMGDKFENDRISRVVTGSPPASPPMTSYGSKSSSSRPRTLNSEFSDRSSTIDDKLYAKPVQEDQANWSPVTGTNNWTGVGAIGAKLRDPTPSSIYSHTPRNSDTHNKSLQPIYENNNIRPHVARISTATAQSSEGPLPNAARASDPDTWPRPPSAGGLTVRTNSVKTTSSVRTAESPPPLPRSFNQDLEPPVEFEEEAPSTPTAITAIPVPASTAMQYTVRKPSPKPVTNSDMSWVNLGLHNHNG